MKWFQSRAPTQRDTLELLRHLFGGISLVNVINRFSVCIVKIVLVSTNEIAMFMRRSFMCLLDDLQSHWLT